MGMFIPEDKFYNEIDRQTGFNRYKQLIGRNWGDWIRINLLTLLGLIPLVLGIALSLANSSLLLLLPCALVGGMIYGPFLACIYDAMLRAMRDDPLPWWTNYKKAWKQNFRGSLIPGAIVGLIMGLFCFIGMLLWTAQIPPTLVTVLLLLSSALILTAIFQQYFTSLVLFDQPALIRLRNMVLFTLLNFKRTFGAALLQLLYWAVYLLFAPWTLLLLPFIGIWYILFVAEFLLYDRLNESYHIEELIEEAASAAENGSAAENDSGDSKSE